MFILSKNSSYNKANERPIMCILKKLSLCTGYSRARNSLCDTRWWGRTRAQTQSRGPSLRYTRRLLYLLCPCVPRVKPELLSPIGIWFVAESSDVFWTLFASIGLPFEQCADSGCLSRILIFVHPGSRTQQEQEEEGEKICCPTFFWSH